MTRSLPEWIGDNDDQDPPQRVRIRVFTAKGGKCHKCRRKIGAADKWTCEHLVAICNGGKNRESNLDLTCEWCLPEKNAADAAIKSKTAAMRARHLGLKPRKQAMAGSRQSRFKRHMDGRVSVR